jgi:hypothetical protein
MSSLSDKKFGITVDSSPCKHATKCLHNEIHVFYLIEQKYFDNINILFNIL